MESLSSNIANLIARLSADSDQARINLRAHQVRSRYRAAIESVYRDTAQLFLDHTNNVYIMKKNDVPTLMVYVDDSLFAAELNAQRELIKLKLLELFGENVEEFDIRVSRGNYKKLHPYSEEDAPDSKKPEPLPPLSESDATYVNQIAATVDDEMLRKSLQKAMTADISRKRVENGSGS